MHLIQILLPLFDNEGKTLPAVKFRKVQSELSSRFDGLTAYSRSAAEGLWKKGKSIRKDDIIVYEVMASHLHSKWWRRYKLTLEKRFRQDFIVIRAQKATLL